MLFPIALLGICMKFFLELDLWGDETITRAIANFSFSVVLSFWIGYYLLNWNRKEESLIEEWGVQQAAQNEGARPDFEGDLKPSPINANEVELQYPKWKQRYWRALSAIISILFIGIVIGVVTGIMSHIPIFIGMFGKKWGTRVGSLCVASQIKTLDIFWTFMAPRLVALQNLKTE